jgi:hypothetical protein
MRTRTLSLLLLLLLPLGNVWSQNQLIKNFILKEHLLQNGQLAIVAVDSLENPVEATRGTYRFVVNGFEQQLAFRDGFGIIKDPLESSTFMFIKHKNVEGTNGKLFYVYKSEGGLRPILIQWYFLLIIPLILLVLAYAFKKLIWLIALVFIGILYFNYKKGLDLSTFFETLIHGLQSLF